MGFPITDQQIKVTEQKLGSTFPQPFRERMMLENGGEVEAAGDVWVLHPFLDGSDKKRLARTCNDILRETQQARRWRDWPEQALCIADNGCGDHLVLLKDGIAIRPEVFAWWHETGELQKVADSFADILK